MSNMRKIAEETGFSVATVSLALRGASRIPEKTREIIRAAAVRHGYTVAPLLSRAFAFARLPEQSRYRETIGMILEYPTHRQPMYQAAIVAHAKKRAESLGYRIDSFQVSGKAADHRRLSRVLAARGIRGLIILPRVGTLYPRLHLAWEHFAAVEIGRTLWTPRELHRVERPIYFELIESFHLLKKAGYKRIGMAVEPTADEKRQGLYTAACLIAQKRLPPRQAIPPLTQFGPWGERSFRAWFKKFRPDVVMIHANNAVPEWLEAMGVSVPGGVSVFGCNVEDTRLSGLTSNLQLYGERAAELLSLLLERNELGLRQDPYCWLAQACWKKGETLAQPLDYPVGGPKRAGLVKG
jgi:LacI family transcriptional regulator